MLVILVLSAIRTRRLVSCDSQLGRTLSGLAAMFNSSSTSHDASTGGKAGSMLHDISRARSVPVIFGSTDARNPGI